MGETFEVARCSDVDACLMSEDTFNKVHNLAKTPLEGSVLCLSMRSLQALVVIFSQSPLSFTCLPSLFVILSFPQVLH